MQLWLCLRLPELAVQCLPQQRPLPVAVLEQQRIHAVNAAAALLGLESAAWLRQVHGGRVIVAAPGVFDDLLRIAERAFGAAGDGGRPSADTRASH